MSVNRKENLYDNLYTAVKNAYASSTGSFCQNKTNELWSKLKETSQTETELLANVQHEMKKLQELKLKKKAYFTNFFVQVKLLLCQSLIFYWLKFCKFLY